MNSVLPRIGAGLASLLLCFSLQAATPNLVVYTYDSFTSDWGPGPQVKAAFEATCTCTLELVGLVRRGRDAESPQAGRRQQPRRHIAGHRYQPDRRGPQQRTV